MLETQRHWPEGRDTSLVVYEAHAESLRTTT